MRARRIGDFKYFPGLPCTPRFSEQPSALPPPSPCGTSDRWPKALPAPEWGHPFAYRRKRLLVDTGEARRRRVYVYVKDDAEQALPTEAYLGVIWRAYRRHGFDEHGLSLALGGER